MRGSFIGSGKRSGSSDIRDGDDRPCHRRLGTGGVVFFCASTRIHDATVSKHDETTIRECSFASCAQNHRRHNRSKDHDGAREDRGVTVSKKSAVKSAATSALTNALKRA